MLRGVLIYLAATCFCAEKNEVNPNKTDAIESEPNNPPAYVLTTNDEEFVQKNVDELKTLLELKDEKLEGENQSAHVSILVWKQIGKTRVDLYKKSFYSYIPINQFEKGARQYEEFINKEFDCRPSTWVTCSISLHGHNKSSYKNIMHKGVQYCIGWSCLFEQSDTIDEVERRLNTHKYAQ